MKLSCGCEVRQLPDETVITWCSLAHRIWLIGALGDLVERVSRSTVTPSALHCPHTPPHELWPCPRQDVDIDTGEDHS